MECCGCRCTRRLVFVLWMQMHKDVLCMHMLLSLAQICALSLPSSPLHVITPLQSYHMVGSYEYAVDQHITHFIHTWHVLLPLYMHVTRYNRRSFDLMDVRSTNTSAIVLAAHSSITIVDPTKLVCMDHNDASGAYMYTYIYIHIYIYV